jgi:hypothetical protein
MPTAKGGIPAGWEVAKFVLPRAPYRTGPKLIQKTNLPPFELRDPVYLPKGTRNLALKKSVTASDENPLIGILSLITDGEKGHEEGQWVELGPGAQWAQIDLQKPEVIYGVLFWHYFAENRVYRDVIVQLSDDADFTKNVRTVFNNDRDNTSGLGAGTDLEFYETREGKWIPIAAQKARYVRLYSRGNTSDPQNQYIEVEVWGVPGK